MMFLAQPRIPNAACPFAINQSILDRFSFISQTEFFAQPTRRNILAVAPGLDAMESEIVETEIQERETNFGGNAVALIARPYPKRDR